MHVVSTTEEADQALVSGGNWGGTENSRILENLGYSPVSS